VAPPASWTLCIAVLLGAVYGGFFGAGLGIMLLAVLGVLCADSLVRLNAVKQAMSLLINVVAAVFFAVSGHVRWELVPTMAVASLIGGTVGGRLVRVINPVLLRRAIVVFGVAVAVSFFVS
ncbi:MAG: TSUP family transporter, partial [Acidimicrobiales bacterium]